MRWLSDIRFKIPAHVPVSSLATVLGQRPGGKGRRGEGGEERRGKEAMARRTTRDELPKEAQKQQLEAPTTHELGLQAINQASKQAQAGILEADTGPWAPRRKHTGGIRWFTVHTKRRHDSSERRETGNVPYCLSKALKACLNCQGCEWNILLGCESE